MKAVQPARPITRRPTVRPRASRTRATPYDVICTVCKTPNPRDRTFCRHCGAPLAQAEAATERLPWWRRLWRWLRRAMNWLFRRSGFWGVLRRIVAIVVALALLVLVVYGGLMLGRKATDAVRDRIAKPQPVRPTSVTASSQQRGHPASAVADGLSNKYWAPGPAGTGRGQYVEFGFNEKFRLLDVIIHSGVSPHQDAFLRQARPAELELTTWTGSGERVDKVLRLADQAGPQTFHRVVGDVVKIRLTIRSSYGGGQGRRSAIAEVEFFRRP